MGLDNLIESHGKFGCQWALILTCWVSRITNLFAVGMCYNPNIFKILDTGVLPNYRKEDIYE